MQVLPPFIPKLIAIDVDGTMLSQTGKYKMNGIPSKRLIQAVKNVSKYMTVCIATGRGTRHTSQIFARNFDGAIAYTIGDDGAIIIQMEDKKILRDFDNNLSKHKEVLRIVLNGLKKLDPDIGIVLDVTDDTTGNKDEPKQLLRDTKRSKDNFNWDSWPDIEYGQAIEVSRSVDSILNPNSEFRLSGASYGYGSGGDSKGNKLNPNAMTLYELWSKFNETNLCKDLMKNKFMYYSDSTDVGNDDGNNNNISNGFNFDEEGYIHISIIDLNRTRPETETLMRFQIGQTDKWQALEQLSHELNIDKSEMMAFGNDFNDIGMFSYCGFSYCSDDGHPQALKTSKSTMPDVEHDGVAIVLEKILEMIQNKNKESKL